MSARDFVRVLTIALFHRWEPGRIFMILTSYFDESGTHGTSPATVMSGIMGTANQWQRFQLRLNRMKRKYGFTVFHAKEFKAARGEFADWPEENYKSLLVELGQASGDLMAAVNCSLPNLEYQQDFRGGGKPKKLRLDSAYGLCFRHCLSHLILEAIRKLGHHKKFAQTTLHAVLESGHPNAGDAERIFNEMKQELQGLNSHLLSTITFAGKTESDPLMVVDFLSHGTLMMELAGRNNPPEGGSDLIISEKATTMTNWKFGPGDLAALKARLIEKVEAQRAWGASRQPSSPSAEKKK
jgi:hypothetical protein